MADQARRPDDGHRRDHLRSAGVGHVRPEAVLGGAPGDVGRGVLALGEPHEPRPDRASLRVPAGGAAGEVGRDHGGACAGGRDRRRMKVLRFDHAACRDAAAAGGKGASLARMAELGLPVPSGFVVPADALAASLPDGGEQLRGIAASDPGRAPQLVQEAVIARELREQIERAYAELGDSDPPVAVRSSACAEDSEMASFAGQQETYLYVRGADRVLARVRDCWASFFSERAVFYRAQKGSLDDLGMAVVVQRMVAADVAGGVFTCGPGQRRRDRMVVEAVLGLGEAAVSGQVTPDHYVIKRDGTVKRAKVARQPFAIVPLEG